MMIPDRHLDIDMTAALSTGTELIDARVENWGNPPLGNALAEMDHAQPERAATMAPDRSPDEPPGRPGWGMQWARPNGVWSLVPTKDGIKQLALDAQRLSVTPPRDITEGNWTLTSMSLDDAVTQYTRVVERFINFKRTINEMSASRKLQSEIDDATWLWCQAAKYERDAAEKYQYWTRYGKELTEPQQKQLSSLRDYGMNNMAEAHIMTRGLNMLYFDLIGEMPKFKSVGATFDYPFERMARVVLTTSCRKLQQYFDTRTQADTVNVTAQANEFLFVKNFYG